MHIRTLLEQARMFRYQDEWRKRTEPSIHVTGRDQRTASDIMLPAYCVAYAFESRGVTAPRRWRSTFATTSVNQSTFMSFLQLDGYDGGGLREIAVKPGTVVAWIEDDFNYRGLGVDATFRSIEVRLERAASKLDSDDPTVQKIYQTLEKLEVTGSMHGTDEAYNKFVEAVAEVDAYIQSGMFLGIGGLLSEALVGAIQEHVTGGRLGVDVVENIPSGNYEVWFEGDYDAILPNG